MQKVVFVLLLGLATLTGCASTPVGSGIEQEPNATGTSPQPARHSELENCVTAVGAERSQCRAK